MLRQRRWVFTVNMAPAISGAAVGLSYFNPKNSGRRARLMTWTPFISNVDLGYLFYREIWNKHDVGGLYVSDGGHSENLGAYALIKRHCKTIIVVDAEHEATIPYVFDGYNKLKRQLAEEMHLALTVPEIEGYLKSSEATARPTGPTPAVMNGDVTLMMAGLRVEPMSVIYIKLGLDRSRLDSYPGNVSDYARKHARFPQDPTSNQSFTTEQFIAYRDLGHHIALSLDQAIGISKHAPDRGPVSVAHDRRSWPDPPEPN
jgi:hypothetical protein